MSLFKKIFSKKNDKMGARHKDQVESLHGADIKYVTEYLDGNDNVVGRGGKITVKDGALLVDSSGDRLFKCEVKNVGINFLMSGDGVIISGANELEGGNARVLTVHFVYHRK